ncbi:Xaa-Pro peptidase family protein [Flavitalea sp. BT771]|uniref:M24 family metallopeptidase n=1 Tax=Flavitalea sp. BT771 TaxID=3063329 RepID=UPI0026E421DC|nr:Xaa-Pro peptidase family protein [Flavitalea sp. BT771]MDO6432206.1 Xaa-Pro peptidase family protein [Flavitalea sp. BT771]MDV6221116.1 Xaa-Pro peptidase family protein [Flavitalea sp. BT771]
MDTRRKAMVDAIIRDHRLAGLLFWRPDELVMMLGYMPLWGISVLLYTADGEPVLFVPELEPEDILPAGVTVKRFPWGVLDGNDPWEVLYKSIREVLTGKDLIGGSISFIRHMGSSAPCRMSGEQPPLPSHLVERFDRVSEGGFKDAGADLLALYACKTASDIAGLLRTHRVAARAVELFYQEVEKRHTEAGLAALIGSAVQEAVGREGIGFAMAWPLVQSGSNAADAGRFNRSTGKVIGMGELVVLEMGVCVDGYWADITRTAVVGEPSELQQRMFDAVSLSQQAAFDLLRPGVAMREVDRAARSCIVDAGFGDLFNHALGHQTGFRYHDPGAVLSPYSTGVLEPGMVLTIEPGVYGTSLAGGLRIEDNVLITGDGHRLLSDSPRQLKGGNHVN